MVFITLGSQKFQFNRLLKIIDKLIEEKVIIDEVFAQIGYSDYVPQNYKYERFLDREQFSLLEERADIVITHGGTGAIIGAVKKGKKVIAIPRLAKYGEHVDDHQTQIIQEFANQNLIFACNDCSELRDMFLHISEHIFDKYNSNTITIIKSIEKFILEI